MSTVRLDIQKNVICESILSTLDDRSFRVEQIANQVDVVSEHLITARHARQISVWLPPCSHVEDRPTFVAPVEPPDGRSEQGPSRGAIWMACIGKIESHPLTLVMRAGKAASCSMTAWLSGRLPSGCVCTPFQAKFDYFSEN